MRLRTFILLVLVLLVGAALVAVVALGILGGTGPLAGLARGGSPPPSPDNGAIVDGEDGAPPAPQPTATPTMRFTEVVVARVPIPAGQRLQPELLRVEMRPDNNIAIQAGYTYSEISELVGRIVRADIATNQEILTSMIALNPTDLATFGSDLSLYVERGRVSVAFPIDRYTGMAYGVRPGDFVDVLMTVDLVQLDPEFQSALPNSFQRVDQQALEEARPFLLQQELGGRLELIDAINAIGLVAPTTSYDQVQQPRRATQLTLQQLEVLWVGNWLDPQRGLAQAYDSGPILSTAPPVDAPPKERPEDAPDILILSLPLQDALALRFAQEAGIQINLALRSQGDNSSFVTTSIHLPQLLGEGLVKVPVTPSDVGIEPRLDDR
jgi:Flp pilus assembly protein CpaB